MKPSFALDFRAEAIALLHRSARGWTEVGQTSFASPDMEEALAFLRSTALGLSPGGFATKLIVPNDQILYLTLHAPGPDAARRRKQITAALEGRTPYATADLVFDWWGMGEEVNVAVIARETLAEAEAFAQAHRFNPLAFVAVPDNGVFQGEPWFGTTSVSAELLAPGEKVDRDQDPVRITSREVPAPALVAPAVTEAPPTALAPKPAPEPAPAPAPEVLPEPEPASAEIAAEGPPEVPPESHPEAPPEPPATETETDFAAVLEPMPEVTLPPAALPDADEAPMMLDVADPEVETPLEPPAPEPRGFSLLRAFSPRRAAPARSPQEPALASRPSPALAASMEPARIADLPPAPTASMEPARIADLPPAPTAPMEPPRIADLPPAQAITSSGIAPAPDRPTEAAGRLTAERPAAPPRPAAGGAKPGARPAKTRDYGAFLNTPPAGAPARPVPPIAAGAAPLPPASPAGARPAPAPASRPAAARPIGLGVRPLPGRAKPRYLGLILTCILLVLLALVGAWSSILASNTATEEPEAALASAAPEPEPVPEPAPEPEPAPDPEQLADLQDLAQADAPLPAILPEPAREAAPATGLVLDNGSGSVTPAADTQDEIFLAALDTPPQPSDAAALGVPDTRRDALPAPAMPPPPFGTVYRFDADGRIIPTPEGIATPEGVLLVAGRPARVPASRPGAVLAAALAARPAAPAPEAGESPEGAGNPSTALIGEAPATPATSPVFADPALQGKRPAPRPEGLRPPADSGTLEGPALAPGAGSRFASLRPAPRPAALTASLVDVASIESAVQSASLLTDAGVLPQDDAAPALSASLVPAARPSDLAADPAPSDQGTDPEADAEPELDGAMPDLPTSASVAKQATVRNAVNLSDLTLVGIFGSDGRRYALVRQPNGRLVKVRVGDKLDGGKVVAITTSEVTYQKSGRAVVLEMPRS